MALYDQNRDAISEHKGLCFGLTFVVPLLLASIFSNQFVSMLDYAGMILVFLAIWGPLAMAVQVRKPQHLLPESSLIYTVSGGNIGLIMTFFFGVFIFVSWFVQ